MLTGADAVAADADTIAIRATTTPKAMCLIKNRVEPPFHGVKRPDDRYPPGARPVDTCRRRAQDVAMQAATR
jgi:hypothetical protein